MSSASFAAQLTTFTKKFDVELNLAVKKIAFEIFRRVSEKTPRATGRASASWNISTNRIDTDVMEPGEYSKGDALSKLQQAPGITAQDVVYITNSLAYIFALEHGHSTQAPTGMVAVTLAEVELWLRNVIQS